MSQRVVVLGASEKPQRYSNMAMKLLKEYGHEVLAVGLREGEVEGVKINKGQPHFDDVDTVTLYVGARNQPDFYDYILNLKPKRVIFNPGTENPVLMGILKDNKVQFELACTLVLLRTDQFEMV